MSGIHLPASARPNNLHIQPHQLSWELDGDTLKWLENLPREVEDGHRMFVVIHEDQPEPFVVMEHCDDGIDRFVLRSKKLGAHEYHLLRRARRIPLQARLAAFEEEEAAHNKHQREEAAAKSYEEIGGPMYHMLHKYGFTDGKGESYPLAGPAVQRSRAARPKGEGGVLPK